MYDLVTCGCDTTERRFVTSVISSSSSLCMQLRYRYTIQSQRNENEET